MFRRLRIKFTIFKETLQRRIYYWKESKYFIEWDFTSILLAEKAAIQRMYNLYIDTKEIGSRELETLKTALNLLDIILGNTEIAKFDNFNKISDYGHKFVLTRKINTRNANRYVNKQLLYMITKDKEEPLLLEDYYQHKAFDIYNRFRTNYLYSWWT